MQKLSIDSLDELYSLWEAINAIDRAIAKLRAESHLRSSAGYLQDGGQRDYQGSYQQRYVNQLISMENRLDLLTERKDDLCRQLLEVLVTLPGESRRNFAFEYYLKGNHDLKKVAGIIGLSLERTYHLKREINDWFVQYCQQESAVG